MLLSRTLLVDTRWLSPDPSSRQWSPTRLSLVDAAGNPGPSIAEHYPYHPNPRKPSTNSLVFNDIGLNVGARPLPTGLPLKYLTPFPPTCMATDARFSSGNSQSKKLYGGLVTLGAYGCCRSLSIVLNIPESKTFPACGKVLVIQWRQRATVGSLPYRRNTRTPLQERLCFTACEVTYWERVLKSPILIARRREEDQPSP